MIIRKEDISPSSNNLQLIREYNESNLKKRRCWYRAVLLIVSLVIFIQIVFYVVLKVQISLITSSNSEQSKAIEQKEVAFKSTMGKNTRMLINLIADIQGNVFRVTKVLRSVAEYDMISKWISKPSFQLAMCYQRSSDGELIMNIVELCSVHKGLLFLFQSKANCRFGAFLNSGFHEFQHLTDESAFLFSIDKKKRYGIKEPEKAFEINDNGIIFGKNDLAITDLFSRPSTSDFSHVYGEGIEEEKNELTCGEREFQLEEIEIYKIFAY